MLCLDFGHFPDHGKALAQQFQNLLIQLVDPLPVGAQKFFYPVLIAFFHALSLLNMLHTHTLITSHGP